MNITQESIDKTKKAMQRRLFMYESEIFDYKDKIRYLESETEVVNHCLLELKDQEEKLKEFNNDHPSK